MTDLAQAVNEAAELMTRILNDHRANPPIGSARFADRYNGASFEKARECDCVYCTKAREWMRAYPTRYNLWALPDDQEQT